MADTQKPTGKDVYIHNVRKIPKQIKELARWIEERLEREKIVSLTSMGREGMSALSLVSKGEKKKRKSRTK